MSRREICLRAILAPVLLACAAASAAEKKPVATDPAEAGPDFRVQGEYVGEFTLKGQKKTVAVQVVALGRGEFKAVGYQGGLPGAGGKKPEPKTAKGTLDGGAVTLKHEDGTPGIGIIKDGVIAAHDKDGSLLVELKKVERKSETLGAKPPPGAVVLFDGTTVDAFDGALLTKDKTLIPDPKKPGAESRNTFGSCTVHVEFRTPFMPCDEGQGRGNSGVYLQGRYEVQVLDSFGIEARGQTARDGDCGGMYSVSPPDVNMCFPPLCWQTYDIEFTAAEFDAAGKTKVKPAKMTVKHNGVVVHEDRVVDHATTASIHGEGPEPKGLFLQNHGCPVQYRNVWVVEKK